LLLIENVKTLPSPGTKAPQTSLPHGKFSLVPAIATIPFSSNLDTPVISFLEGHNFPFFTPDHFGGRCGRSARPAPEKSPEPLLAHADRTQRNTLALQDVENVIEA
jgi:hypothetical protein